MSFSTMGRVTLQKWPGNLYSRDQVLDGPETLRPDDYYYTLYIENNLVSSAVLKRGNGCWVLRFVTTKAEFRRRGYATLLLTSLGLHPDDWVVLYVDPLNEAAVNLYKTLGFKMIKEGCAFGGKYGVVAKNLVRKENA